MINIRAKKSLGQNFLKNPRILDSIVAAAELSKSETVLEIGPGTGFLTERLSIAAGRVVAVEKDQRLILGLQQKFSGSNVEIVEGDILKIKPEDFGLEPGKYSVVANIPYYLTSHLIRLILTAWPKPKCAILMVQEEVAKRIVAKPPDMNLLGLSVRAYAETRIVSRVSRGNFSPMPDVDSAVISIVPKTDKIRDTEREDILRLASAAFHGKRKMLSNTLSGATGHEKKEISNLLESLGLNPKIRPEEVSLESWINISKELSPALKMFRT
ncbi:MAG: 16S rRNA (adenine(1518)-N(6)/adenine(1519)-N(6))-dimethyltransferase RsmA [Patescibacteria group bacterium]